VEPRGPSMTAISDAGLCFDAAGRMIAPVARGRRGLWPPWFTEWSDYLAPKRERTPTMYSRPARAWLTPPPAAAMARLGAPVMLPRRRGRRLSSLGQDEWFEGFGDWDSSSWGLDTAEVPAIDVSSSWFSDVDWGAIGSAAGTVIQAATPLALPLLQQAIYGGPTAAAPRPAPPPGYTYSSAGQLMRLPAAMQPPGAASTWSTPLLLLGGAAVVGGAIYFTRGTRRR